MIWHIAALVLYLFLDFLNVRDIWRAKNTWKAQWWRVLLFVAGVILTIALVVRMIVLK
jgi:hypothetical protein